MHSGLALDTVAQLRLHILRLERRVRQRGRTGVTPSQLSALSTIERHGPLRIGEVARRERISKSSVTRLVAKLEDKGYVTRSADPSDGRSSTVALTADGQRLMVASRERADAYLSQQLALLTNDERERLEAAIPVLEQLLVRKSGMPGDD